MLRTFDPAITRQLSRSRCQCGIPNISSGSRLSIHSGSNPYKTLAYYRQFNGIQRSPDNQTQVFNLNNQTILQGTPLLSIRSRRNFSSKNDPGPASITKGTPSKPASKSPSPTTHKEDWKIISHLLPNIWPKDDRTTKIRVILNVQVPFLFKHIIDTLSIPLDPSTAPGAWTVMDLQEFPLRSFPELRSAIFTNVAQSAIRRVARSVFSHLLNVDVGFHLRNQTGGLTRAIDRGTKGVSFMLSSIVFHVVPTALEISIVCSVLTYNFGASYAGIALATMLAYSWFTIRTTAWR
ncbi:hypothetical protein Pst134EA_019252 [Puccinia striiformis f. sp. tritici]|uniref:hypothetical protein n=1 Tax=Puccinia striiformis f. sp. tritici TaxID=168172 RepID=UPI00200883C5|nr:hypothetical protein Pst134EA_019252 [Puccinia striiformis f. sp. tritici]KAH9459101.1 hypothetical protein Pst134EA_019252 [Puccinia striiformis f. sp. tritici]